ncbi:AfsR/SARP family transcriptional regulator [Kutzneria sp. CA-103260]|uniref:AfsR/SARP family transcriptional regulator n=1 Tax=Kutzneria sp. CA-103260 TaxID=2802641 RepID=UPI001BACF904|nr:BTAD domain-containing putative transcriptional regulator [Kutzneria sp. CA-103260]QUQ63847.1 SARP family transcriptional regulator [Kutzneria sp. CA-103260]
MGDSVFVGLLGSLEVRMADRSVTPSAPKLRTILALLALNADTVAHLDQIVEELWEHNPPGSPSTTVQTYVYQLRKLLARGQQDVGGVAVLTRAQGYEFRLGRDCEVDVRTFEVLLERGRRALDHGRTEEAAQLLRDALGQWRGPAFGGVTTGPLLSARAAHLEESRKSALELRFEADLALGRHRRVVDELAGVVKAQPTHEGFSAKLMTALYRCGRRVEALETYQKLRAEFVAQLGLVPSAALSDLHQAVLTDAPSLLLPATAPVRTGLAPEPAAEADELEPAMMPITVLPLPAQRSPVAQVPPASFHFVGRQAEVETLAELLGSADAGDRPGLRMVEVAGPPGVGKTALAVTVAHQVRKSYPDGQIFVDLRPVNNGEADLGDVLAEAMRAAGVPMPAFFTGLGYAFRAWSAEQRLLVVVDDVMSVDQLDSIRPSGPGSAMLVTSRRRLHSPGVTFAMELPSLSIEDGIRMLAGVVGEQRVHAEIEQAAALVRMCGGLPQLIGAVGARLAYRRSWTLAQMRHRIVADPTALLRISGGAGLRETLLGNSRSLPELARAALWAAAGREVDTVSAAELAVLLGISVATAEDLLETLADAYLVEEVVDLSVGATTRFRVTAHVRELTDNHELPASVLQSGFSTSPLSSASLVLDSEDAVVDHGPAGRTLTG